MEVSVESLLYIRKDDYIRALRRHVVDVYDQEMLDAIAASSGLSVLALAIVKTLADKYKVSLDFGPFKRIWFHVGHPVAGFEREGKPVKTLPWGTTIHDILVETSVFESQDHSRQEWKGGELEDGMNVFSNVGPEHISIFVVVDREGDIFER